MTREWHFKEAEQLLAEFAEWRRANKGAIITGTPTLLTSAQAHAMLASVPVHGVDLTADEIHVLLDLVGGGGDEPWTGYTTDPADDPKATEQGWRALLRSAERKLTERLNTA